MGVCSNEGPRPFLRGDNYDEIAEIYWCHLIKHLLLQNHRTNFKLTWRKSYLGEGIQICSNEWLRPFSRGNNNDIAKIHKKNLLQNRGANFNQIHWKCLKSYKPETRGHFQPNLAQSIFRLNGFRFVQMRGHTLLFEIIIILTKIYWHI